jgi:predicted nucleic acid-binding Zn ribbon protein
MKPSRNKSAQILFLVLTILVLLSMILSIFAYTLSPGL